MKTCLKILSGAAVAAIVVAVSANEAQAGGSYSFGFGYRSGGCGPRWGVGYSFGYSGGCYRPPVYYSAPPVVYYSVPPPPTVVYSAPVRTVPAPVVVASQSMGVADVKALAKCGLADEVIISQIRNSRAVFRLTTAEIIELKDSGVSQRVIDFMINTANS